MRKIGALLLLVSCVTFAAENKIDVSMEVLPKGFKPSSFNEVYTSKRPSTPIKGEFEPTARYETRLATWTEKQQVKASNNYGFFIPFTLNYDADSEMFSIEIAFTSVYDYGEHTYIEMVRKPTPTGSYTATNLFGAQFVIQKSTVYLDRLEVSSSFTDYTQHSLELNATPVEAKKLSDNIAVLIYGSAVPPFTVGKKFVFEPTVKDPRDITYIQRDIFIQPIGVWIVNKRTGKILLTYEW